MHMLRFQQLFIKILNMAFGSQCIPKLSICYNDIYTNYKSIVLSYNLIRYHEWLPFSGKMATVFDCELFGNEWTSFN